MNINFIPNILFVTLDSCSVESAQKANLVNLPKISRMRVAETPGNYTYSAHSAFFIGNLPRLIYGNDYLPGYNSIWRSIQAKSEKSSLFHFSESNIISFHKNVGYDCIGMGGVSFFDPQTSCNYLSSLFDTFYYSKDQKKTEATRKRDLNSFSLDKLEIIINNISNNKPFFLFINAK
ncbi:MAG: hypothetical protein IPP81_19370 [Chitinophagaceae bacterium]|nr:hypothetical protein [Chitinophagaceae bacterium]